MLDPGRQVVLGDGTHTPLAAGQVANVLYSENDFMTTRHGSKFIVAYADGHVGLTCRRLLNGGIALEPCFDLTTPYVTQNVTVVENWDADGPELTSSGSDPYFAQDGGAWAGTITTRLITGDVARWRKVSAHPSIYFAASLLRRWLLCLCP